MENFKNVGRTRQAFNGRLEWYEEHRRRWSSTDKTGRWSDLSKIGRMWFEGGAEVFEYENGNYELHEPMLVYVVGCEVVFVFVRKIKFEKHLYSDWLSCTPSSLWQGLFLRKYFAQNFSQFSDFSQFFLGEIFKKFWKNIFSKIDGFAMIFSLSKKINDLKNPVPKVAKKTVNNIKFVEHFDSLRLRQLRNAASQEIKVK